MRDKQRTAAEGIWATGRVELLLRYFWIAFIVVTVLNGRGWWSRVQSRIQSQPDLEPGYRRLYRGYLLWMNLPWFAMGLGILLGLVPSMVDFLRPSEGNAFVLAWWGLMGALLCLGTYWVFVAGGAEMLERHPGVLMVPPWPAAKLRIFWLVVVAWNVAGGTLLFLYSPGPPGGPGEGHLSWFWAFFPLLFVGFWLLISFAISALGGWSTLAGHYAATVAFSGRRFYLRSAQLSGSANYGGCLTIGAGPQGLYLAVLPPFRVAHPPLVIPWTDITASETRSWFFEVVELQFAKAPGVSVRLSRRLAQAVFDASGAQVVVHRAV